MLTSDPTVGPHSPHSVIAHCQLHDLWWASLSSGLVLAARGTAAGRQAGALEYAPARERHGRQRAQLCQRGGVGGARHLRRYAFARVAALGPVT